jgi:hypothetical protein
MSTNRIKHVIAVAGLVAALVALAVVLQSGAAPGPDAAKADPVKQRVAFTTQAAKTTHASPFVLTPLEAGALKRDSGTLTAGLPPARVVMRGGQRVEVYDDVVTLKGKLGTLEIRDRAQYVDAGNGYDVGTSTWTVLRGTGQYAGVTGGGRSGNVVLDRGSWSGRAEGYLKGGR